MWVIHGKSNGEKILLSKTVASNDRLVLKVGDNLSKLSSILGYSKQCMSMMTMLTTEAKDR